MNTGGRSRRSPKGEGGTRWDYVLQLVFGY